MEAGRAEEARGATKAQFSALVESVHDHAIFMLDPDGRVISWNPGAERIKGYRAEEILGRHFSCFYAAEDIERGWPERHLQDALERGRCAQEGWRLRMDGSRFWARVAISPVRDRAGGLIGFAMVTRDETERRQAEERLLKVNQDLEARVQERTAQLKRSNTRRSKSAQA